MDLAIKQIISTLLLLPASALLLAALGLLLAWRGGPRRGDAAPSMLRRTVRKLGFAFVALALAILWLASTPVLVNQWVQAVEREWSVWQANTAQPAQAVVVLGGGRNTGALEYGGATLSSSSLQRLRYGIRLAKANQLPLMFSGGNADPGTTPDPSRTEAALAQRVALEDFGLPLRWVEGNSRDTQENAQGAASLLKPREAGGIKTIVLVTDVWHMRRAVPWFEAEGFTVQAAPMGFMGSSENTGRHWLPNAGALAHANQLWREQIGLAWQALRR